MDEVVFHQTFRGEVVALRAFGEIHFLPRHIFLVAETGGADAGRISHEADRACSDSRKKGALNAGSPVELAEEYTVTSNVSYVAVLYAAVLGPFQEDGPAPVDGPIGAQQRLIFLHECPRGMLESYSLEGHVSDRILFGAFYGHQILETRGLEIRQLRILADQGVVI